MKFGLAPGKGMAHLFTGGSLSKPYTLYTESWTFVQPSDVDSLVTMARKAGVALRREKPEPPKSTVDGDAPRKED